jgi:ATP-dependent exoDNAse (exonuclease V) alpha subunit
LQIKANGTSREGRPLANGEIVTVASVAADGSLVVKDNGGAVKTIGADQRLLNLGYAVTSYGSQGKTVESVILADSGSKGATSDQQWYVTISRARRRVLVLTASKQDLAARILNDARGELGMDVRPLKVSPASAKRRAGRETENEPVQWAQRVARRVQVIGRKIKNSLWQQTNQR